MIRNNRRIILLTVMTALKFIAIITMSGYLALRAGRLKRNLPIAVKRLRGFAGFEPIIVTKLLPLKEPKIYEKNLGAESVPIPDHRSVGGLTGNVIDLRTLGSRG